MGKRRMLGLLISLEQRQLVLNSEIINNYTELKEILEKYEKVFKSDFEDTSDFSEDVQNKILYIFNEIVAEASKEWVSQAQERVIESNDRNDWEQCKLCNTANKLIYFIKNRHNNIELNVGSDCIEKFPGINDNVNGLNVSQRKRLQRKKIQNLNRINKINTRYPNAKKLVYELSEAYNNLPIVMPVHIHNKVQGILIGLKNIYSDYVKGKLKDDAIDDFGDLLDDYKELDLEIIKLIKDNKDKEFICKYQTKVWLENNGLSNILYTIRRNDGFITLDTIKYIANYEFFIYQFNKFKKLFENQKFSLASVNNNRIHILYYDQVYRYNLRFSSSIRNFMLIYGTFLLGNAITIDTNNFVNQLDVVWDQKNIELVIKKFNSEPKGYRFKLRFIRNEIEINDLRNKEYVVIVAQNYINKNKALIVEDNISDKLLSSMKEFNWRPYEEKDTYGIDETEISKNPYK